MQFYYGVVIDIWCAVLVLMGLGTISFTHYAYRWRNPKCRDGKLPPGSMGFPLIGETIQFLIPSYSLDTPPFIKKRVARYGKLFKTSLAGKKMVITTDPEISNYIFMEEGKSVHLWYMDSFDNFLGEALINSTATAYIHKYLKNLFLNHVGNESLKDKLLPKIELMANQALHSWSTQPSVEVKECTANMVIELVLKELLGYDSTKSTHNLVKMLSEFIKGIINIPLNVPGTTFHRCMKNQRKVLNLMKDILRKRQNSTGKREGDFLDQLIDDVNKEEFMTEELAAVLMIALVFASFETVSTAFRVAMMFLTDEQPHNLVLKKLLEEQQAIIDSRENVDSPLTWKEYKSMTFTPHVINETLRMTNGIPGIVRKANKDVHINGYVIPKGWIIMVSQTAIHMNPDKFKDPLSFNPWRWNDIGPNIMGKSFIPFGGGKRNCAGTEFTKVLMSVFLHVLVTKFSWTKVKGGQAVRRPGLSVKDGFHVKISPKIEYISRKRV
ncbi:hypothetical protein C5167_035636 [Papaver somniferum]|uniref:Cytochrome P450 n=1 Tax=Papaver somniferum TaxID=3469 RepID=A0A4Y7KJU9_PAPSO|nr:cytochrome P450 87A3-like [Papaver somniferum]RZC72219.1 hypothetical protein C5167_035636 [Papaver somniferum]